MGDASVYGRMILKFIFKKMLRICELGNLARGRNWCKTCEHNDKSLAAVKGGEFCDYLSDC